MTNYVLKITKKELEDWAKIGDILGKMLANKDVTEKEADAMIKGYASDRRMEKKLYQLEMVQVLNIAELMMAHLVNRIAKVTEEQEMSDADEYFGKTLLELFKESYYGKLIGDKINYDEVMSRLDGVVDLIESSAE